jgi:hypothetical protein
LPFFIYPLKPNAKVDKSNQSKAKADLFKVAQNRKQICTPKLKTES